MLCANNLRPANFATLNWKKIEPDENGVIYWHIVNFTDDQPKHKTLLAFTTAFDIWQEAFDSIKPVGRVIQFKPTSDFHEAHLRLFFMNPKKRKQVYAISDGTKYTLTNDWPFDGPQGVLAHRPPNKHEIHFDEGEQWSDIHKYEKSTLFVNLMAVVLHETGHSFDLDHSNVRGAVMEATYDGNRIALHPDDRAGVQHVWGSIKDKIRRKLAAKAPAPAIIDYGSSELVSTCLKHYGTAEVPGPQSNPEVLGWIHSMFPNAKDDGEVAWCSIYMNIMAKEAGYEFTGSGMAKSWLKVGKEVSLEDARIGDVVIFDRGSDPRFGHVALYLNDRSSTMIRVLGGNQQDAVNIRSYYKSRIAGIRRLAKT